MTSHVREQPACQGAADMEHVAEELVVQESERYDAWRQGRQSPTAVESRSADQADARNASSGPSRLNAANRDTCVSPSLITVYEAD